MATPDCDYCKMFAQYDFVDSEGNWRYGCITHWQKHRASRQLGAGHAMHISKGAEPPPRPAGYVPPPLGTLAKPQIAPNLIRPTPVASPTTPRDPAKPRAPKDPSKPRSPREFTDMPAKSEVKGDPRPGSVLAVTLDLIRTSNGATLAEIDAAIGPKHDALKLLQWANENKGYGWRQDENKKIHTVYYGKSE